MAANPDVSPAACEDNALNVMALPCEGSASVSREQLVAGITKIYSDGFRDFTSIRALRQSHRRWPEARDWTCSILSTFSGQVFKEYLVVVAEVRCVVITTRPRAEEPFERRIVWRSLHFVHQCGCAKHGAQPPELQSVFSPEDPLLLECYGRHVVTFSLGLLPPATNTPRLQQVLVLGLGGAVIPQFFAAASAHTAVDVVEIEPAVVNACGAHGLLSGVRTTHIGDAAEVLLSIDRQYDVVIVDCFDPYADTMLHATTLLERSWRAVSENGVLIVNAHITPDAITLEPFVQVLGEHVHVLRRCGLTQTFVLAARCGAQGTTVQNVREFRAAVKSCTAVAPKLLDEQLVHRSHALAVGSRQVRIWEEGDGSQ